MKSSEILCAAKLLIEAGWCQNKYETDGCFCLMDAIHYVDSSYYTVYAIESRYINPLIPDEFRGPRAWNDHSKRTKQEVLELLDKAVENAALAND